MTKKTVETVGKKATKKTLPDAGAEAATLAKNTPNALATSTRTGGRAGTTRLKKAGKTIDTALMAEGGATPNAANFVGPPTAELKEKFSAQRIPLQTDFANLIDVADCGRNAVGLNPDQPGGTGAGLQLDNESRLAVLPQSGGGIKVDDSGVSVDFSRVLPVGIILMFSGSTIPQGWALCDGENSRPDLRNRFVIGGSGAEINTRGGNALTGTGANKEYSVDTNSVTAGSITVSIQGTSLNQSQMPAHNHINGLLLGHDVDANLASVCKYGVSNSGYVSNSLAWTGRPNGYGAGSPYTETKGEGAPHTHSGGATQGQHSHNITKLPAYYILAYIIKIAEA